MDAAMRAMSAGREGSEMTNDQITVSRALLRQAIDALSDTQTDGESPQWDIEKAAYDALRAALDAPAVEPYGYYFREDHTKFAMPGTGFRLGSTPPSDAEVCIPLFTAPKAPQPAPPADVPMLTDDEIRKLADKADEWQESAEYALAYARAIEQAVHQKAGLK